jgi:hypothetical protein
MAATSSINAMIRALSGLQPGAGDEPAFDASALSP